MTLKSGVCSLLVVLAVCNFEAAAQRVGDDEAELITPPIPSYPLKAAMAGLSGMCEVHMDVTPAGKPVNIRAKCTHEVFCDESMRAMAAVVFAPKIVNGEALWRNGVAYPLEYLIEGSSRDFDPANAQWCASNPDAVS
ncbi:MAG: energy transducer TonB [Pseudomonadota bacterium]